MERFNGKKIIQVSVKDAIRIPKELIEKILNGEGELYQSSSNSKSKFKKDFSKKEKNRYL